MSLRMSKVQEIEAAIQALSPTERGELLSVLPNIFPELDGDAEWARIINANANPTFSRYLDEIEAGLTGQTLELRETSEEEFRRHS